MAPDSLVLDMQLNTAPQPEVEFSVQGAQYLAAKRPACNMRQTERRCSYATAHKLVSSSGRHVILLATACEDGSRTSQGMQQRRASHLQVQHLLGQQNSGYVGFWGLRPPAHALELDSAGPELPSYFCQSQPEHRSASTSTPRNLGAQHQRS